MIGGEIVGKFNDEKEGERYDITARLAAAERDRPSAIDALWTRSNTGELVRLKDVATVETGKGPTVIMHYNRHRAATLFAGTEHETVTVYYLEGDQLVLVHYCAIGNQPKMVLSKRSTAGELKFDFAGGSNLKPKKDTHMHSARIRFADGGIVVGEWETFKAGKPPGTHRFYLTRKT